MIYDSYGYIIGCLPGKNDTKKANNFILSFLKITVFLISPVPPRLGQLLPANVYGI